MFAALAKPIGLWHGVPVANGFSLMAVSLVGFTGVRFLSYRAKYNATSDAARKNAMIAGYDEAQQSFNWALGIGAALVVVPRVIKAVMR